ncbi:MAG: hypothetical protein PHE55_01195 [Methylococcaceae bacterium]|nr:hypothetical protein [Methylococcaceae bacterium]
MKTLYSILLLLAISGCAAHRAEIAQRARSELVGLSKTQLLQCMGPSQRQERSESGEILIFSGATPNYSCPLRMGETEPPRRYCEAAFVLENGVVKTVGYREPNGNIITQADRCAFLVEKCVR